MTDLFELLYDCKPLSLFSRDKKEGSLAHAYALFGDDAFAMEWILRRMARIAVCEKGGCGECSACKALEGGVHPDVKFSTARLRSKTSRR